MPFLIPAGLALALVFYCAGLRRMPRNLRQIVFSPLRNFAFVSALAILFAALVYPLDGLDDQLFCAHMAQHLVLMMVAPPLLVAARPALASLWAFPLPARRALGHFFLRSGLCRTTHALMAPLAVWIFCSAALWFWHLPGPYGWAMENELVHAVEHLCFFVTSLMFWSLVLEPAGRHRRLGHAGALLFVASFGIENGMLGAILTFSAHPLYKAYFTTTAAWGLSPLEDQQLGGLGMWIPAGLFHLTTLCVLFLAWMRAETASQTKDLTFRPPSSVPVPIRERPRRLPDLKLNRRAAAFRRME